MEDEKGSIGGGVGVQEKGDRSFPLGGQGGGNVNVRKKVEKVRCMKISVWRAPFVYDLSCK